MASKPVPKKAVKPTSSSASGKHAASSPAKNHVSVLADIAKLDQDIVKLLNRRAVATIKLIEASPDRRTAIYDPRSDDDLFAKLEAENLGPLTPRAIRGVF